MLGLIRLRANSVFRQLITTIIASGVSGVDINVGSKLDIDLSGVSTMTYGGSPSLGTVRVDALSTLKRR